MELGRHAASETDPLRVLTVCTANICRSPAAERLLQGALDAAGVAAEVSSAGVQGWRDAPMDQNAAAALRQVGGNDEGFRSRPIEEPYVRDADLILTATLEQRGALLAEYPRGLRKTFTMKEFAHLAQGLAGQVTSSRELVTAAFASRGAAELGDYDVDDPYGGPESAHVRTVGEVKKAMETVADAIARSSS